MTCLDPLVRTVIVFIHLAVSLLVTTTSQGETCLVDLYMNVIILLYTKFSYYTSNIILQMMLLTTDSTRLNEILEVALLRGVLVRV